MLRNVSGVPLEPATEDALNSIAAEMKIGRSDPFRSCCANGWKPTPICRFERSTRKAKPAAVLRTSAITEQRNHGRLAVEGGVSFFQFLDQIAIPPGLRDRQTVRPNFTVDLSRNSFRDLHLPKRPFR